MFKLFKTRTLGRIAVLLVVGVILATCDMEMGLGPSIDLEPPVLNVTGIIRPDGTVDTIEEGSKLFIGPGIRVGVGFTLVGTTQDNVSVEQIVVEETGPNAKIVNGRRPTWTNAIISSANRGEKQTWSITLDGIEKGERMISITAYDRPRNIGPDTVKQLTLLVDTDPPFVKDIKIRRAGLEVPLLPRATLQTYDLLEFAHVDYFQNEKFDLRAEIEHDFPISAVYLNFVDVSGNRLFDGVGIEPASGTVYAPLWNIDSARILNARPAFASGRHYLNVVITVKAEAGHTGTNDKGTGLMSNTLYNLCWWPEADYPRIKEGPPPLQIETSGTVLVNVFDDDEVGEVYGAMVTLKIWNEFMAGTDEQKMQWLVTGANKDGFTDQRGATPLRNPISIASPTRNTQVAIRAGEAHGEHKMIVLTRDRKGALLGPWVSKLITVMVLEEGVPIISISKPEVGVDTPSLDTQGRFALEGSITNVNEVEILRVLWSSAALKLTVTEQENHLRNSSTGVVSNGIRIWDIPLISKGDLDVGGGKLYKLQEFKTTFNIFSDFIYNNAVENDSKSFMLYTKNSSNGLEVFETLLLMSYKKSPDITVISPKSNPRTEVEPGVPVEFEFTVVSPLGVPIQNVTLEPQANTLSLRAHATEANTWIARATQTVLGNYFYTITAVDRLGNSAVRETQFTVTKLPDLVRITSPHPDDKPSGYFFATGETITIQAEFTSPVYNVDIAGGIPRIRLENLTLNGTTTPVYATYVSGASSNTLIFEYTIPSGYATATAGLSATRLEVNGGYIGASGLTLGTNTIVFATSSIPTLPTTKVIRIDSVSPLITGIKFTVETQTVNAEGNSNWLRAPAEINAEVLFNKPIKEVRGTPKLNLPLDSLGGVGMTGEASFSSFTAGGGTNGNGLLVLRYKVLSTQQTSALNVVRASYFSDDDLVSIRDTRGAEGNPLARGTGNITITYENSKVTPPRTTAIQIDARPPASLDVGPVAGNPKRYQITNTGAIEAVTDGRKVQYSTDGGQTWLPNTGTLTLATPWQFDIPAASDVGYFVMARQIDRAGNISEYLPPVVIEPEGTTNLVAVVCDEPDRTYRATEILHFKLIFTNLVRGTPRSITLWGGGTPATIPVTFTGTLPTGGTDTIEYSWTIPAGLDIKPVRVLAVDLSGLTPISGTLVDSVDKTTIPGGGVDYLGRPDLAVLSTPITLSVIVPASGLVPTNDTTSTLTLTFNRPVEKEMGIITVKPAAGWYIPPVLSNDDYSRVYNAVNDTQKGRLDYYYAKTTHGLTKNVGGQYTGTPDTSTKYVLRFDTDLNVPELRTIFEAAKYLWQEIEVVSESQVKIQNPDTNKIDVTLDRLLDGRQWEVAIAGNCFRDIAGNYYTSSGTPTTFWSATTAVPVIRVNRVSNNRPTAAQTTPADYYILRTNVQYRIDCETPGATIGQVTWNKGPATGTADEQARGNNGGIASLPATYNSAVTYQSSADETSANITNSNILDATAADLDTMNPGTTGYTHNTTNPLTVGDTEMYTARKDYIAARAKHANLEVSARGYEGAFKTVIVYRNAGDHFRWDWNDGTNYTISTTTNTNNHYVKVEGVDQRNGPVKISGFPLNMNEMDGSLSKYAYRNLNTAVSTTVYDHIWITWEIVSDFWHVGITVRGVEPNQPLHADAPNSWQAFSGDWYTHNYRKYGNWGLRVGGQYNMPNTSDSITFVGPKD
jgi:hypothetical protein